MNLGGKFVPSPHPTWGACADELLFHTSRYACYTAHRLSEFGACPGFDMQGFDARAMSPAQRGCMARLLALAPNRAVAGAVAELARTVARGEPQLPKESRKIAGKCRARPHLRITPSRPRRSAGLNAVHPGEVLLHLGRRYGFPVAISGRHVWLDDARVARLLRRKRTRQATNIQEALDALRRRNYRVHLPDAPAWSVGCRTAH